MLEKTDPVKARAWKKLNRHYKYIKNKHMRDFFACDEQRFSKYSIDFEDLFLDYSKNIITQDTLNLLFELAEEVKVRESIQKMFSGEKINETENRPVLHIALRNSLSNPIYVDGKNIMEEISRELDHIRRFSIDILEGNWKGYSGERITDIVNIGIGGSDLGPVTVTEALKPYWDGRVTPHFVSNIDGSHLTEVFKKIRPESTVFMVASKTFTTNETMTNARSARKWFIEKTGSEENVRKQFVALSTNEEEVVKFGIAPENMFRFWDWVGGRYSLWSSIGLSIAATIGFDNFKELLDGARMMDEHFCNAPFERNIPVILALLGIWYNNFFGVETEAMLPYDQYMHRLPDYFQQGNMESNGKYISRKGEEVTWQTGPIIWGRPGTNGQHAFFQLIHQGTKLIPCDFIVPAITHNPLNDQHKILVSNAIAQTEALMHGKTLKEAVSELEKEGKSKEEIRKLAPYKTFKGNRPTNLIMVKKITPRALGKIIAMYEHKIFVQGVIWNIFSFDQWGVQLGKQLAKRIISEIDLDKHITTHDSSTNGLIDLYRKWR